jgi:tryptophan 2,3-dioxygenase
MTDRSVTYGSYLAIDELLALQRPRSEGPEHDEMLFIVIHQVYELWFKQLLHEVDHVIDLLEAREAPRVDPGGPNARTLRVGVEHTMKRILTILKVLVAQLDILETMTPLEFQSFRSRLEAASGFQSDQFRQLEFVLGNKSKAAIDRFGAGTRARNALEHRYARPTLWDAFLHYLSREGYAVPEPLLTRDLTAKIEPSGELQSTLIEVYRTDPGNAELCERLVDLDEGIQEWRYRHVKMVQRTIGAKAGTGGSSGAQYLATTLMTPIFPDLWEIRSRL